MATIQTLENINIEEVCRACLESCEQYKLLFEDADISGKRSMGDVFFDVVKIEQLQTKTNTESPSRICLPCSKDLINAYKFIEKSQQNNERLLEYLKNSSMKYSDCLSEFPIDIPDDAVVDDFLQIKVENEAISEYAEPLPEDKISPPSSSDSAGSDYDDLPLHEEAKINRMQCTYCDRVFKRPDFLENHKRKHEEEMKKKEDAEEASSTILCDECGFCCSNNLELKTHRLANHTDSECVEHTDEIKKANEEYHLFFVEFIKNNIVILSKSQMPEIIKKKKEILEKCKIEYETKYGKTIELQQISKKIVNMKARIKERCKISKMSNKRVKLKLWEKKLLDIMSCISPNLVLHRSEGPISVRRNLNIPRTADDCLSSFAETKEPAVCSSVKMKREINDVMRIYETSETKNLSLADLQRLVLLKHNLVLSKKLKLLEDPIKPSLYDNTKLNA